MLDRIPIRHLGIHTSQVVTEEARQLNLFDNVDYEKLERMDRAVDNIRKRVGVDSIIRASFIKTDKVDHMSGGISREKRTVDYNKQNVLYVVAWEHLVLERIQKRLIAEKLKGKCITLPAKHGSPPVAAPGP